MFGLFKKTEIPSASSALPGRDAPIPTADTHFVNGNPLKAPYPDSFEQALFGLGCFWGAERKFWEADGIWVTSVGYAAGITPNPTYKEVCTGGTGHNEVVHVVFDPSVTSFEAMLKLFWESHNPTQGMRQGNDVGTQYRSGIYTYSDTQTAAARESLKTFQPRLDEKGFGKITTEILPAPEYFYAEDYHQQYLAKNPDGYCGLGGTGVSCPIGVATGS